MPRKTKSVPRRRRRQVRRKVRVPRGMNPAQHDVASCTDTLGFISVAPNTPYTLQNIALTNSARAKTIAQGYQFYRITKVEVKWKPYVDTFTAANTLSVPTLYYMIDKANTFPSNSTVDTLKQAGARPRRLDDKILSVKFAPAVHLASDDGAIGPASTVETAGMMKVSPWITTNANAGGSSMVWAPNSVDHRGLIFYVEQQSTAGPDAGVCSAEVILHYQFKKPLWTAGAQSDTVHRIDLDTLEIVPPELPESKVVA